MSAVDDDDTHQLRWSTATERLDAVREHFISAAIAEWMGMPDEHQAAGLRAWDLLKSLEPRDIALIVAVAIWPGVEKEAVKQLTKLRDFHYVDERRGLLPTPPGGAR